MAFSLKKMILDKSDKLDENTLKLHGCVCSSPNLEFTSTDPKIMKEHPDFFGTYSYKVSFEIGELKKRLKV